MDGKWPTKWFDIDLDKVISFNLYEKARLGLGITTPESFSKIINISGYYGYGFDDGYSKYGGALRVKTSEYTHISAKYDNTITEIGEWGSVTQRPIYDSKSFLASRFDRTQHYRFTYVSDKNGFKWTTNALPYMAE